MKGPLCLYFGGCRPTTVYGRIAACVATPPTDKGASGCDLSNERLLLPLLLQQMIHKLTARALIRDYEDGMLHENETSHEVRPWASKNR